MRNRLIAVLFCCLLAATAAAQQPASSTPSSAPQAQKPTAEKAAGALKSTGNGRDYSQESFVIEKMYSHYRFEADGTGRKETIARIRV